MSMWFSILRHRPCKPWSWCTECRSPYTPHHVWNKSMTGTGCHEMSHPERNTVHLRQAKTCMLWRHWTALPAPGLMRKELKNRWRFLWSMPVNHSDYLGNRTIQHLPPAPQSRFLSPPAPLTSSCHYIFFEIPFMKNESPLPANTGLSLYQASHSHLSIFWGQGANQRLLQLSPHLPGKNATEQDQQPGGKM